MLLLLAFLAPGDHPGELLQTARIIGLDHRRQCERQQRRTDRAVAGRDHAGQERQAAGDVDRVQIERRQDLGDSALGGHAGLGGERLQAHLEKRGAVQETLADQLVDRPVQGVVVVGEPGRDLQVDLVRVEPVAAEVGDGVGIVARETPGVLEERGPLRAGQVVVGQPPGDHPPELATASVGIALRETQGGGRRQEPLGPRARLGGQQRPHVVASHRDHVAPQAAPVDGTCRFSRAAQCDLAHDLHPRPGPAQLSRSHLVVAAYESRFALADLGEEVLVGQQPGPRLRHVIVVQGTQHRLERGSVQGEGTRPDPVRR